MQIRTESIDSVDETKILISMITNTDFLKSVMPIAEREHFLSPFSQRLFLWIKEYFDDYGKAPDRHIKDIFNAKKVRVKNDEIELIELFLVNLNRHFEEGFNEDYYADQATAYLEKRALEVNAERILSLTKLGQIEEARKVQADYKKVAKSFGSAINPLSPDFIDRTFTKKEGSRLFKLPGAIGDITGFLCRKWLVIIQAPYKTGKTFWLQFMREIAMLNGLRVLDINFEMSEEELAFRMYKGMTGLPEDDEEDLNVIWPVFDCLNNQVGACPFPERRMGSGQLYELGNLKPSIGDGTPTGYKICDVCRKRQETKKDFVEDIWYETITKSEFVNPITVQRKASAVQKQYGDLLRFKSFPRGSANVGDIERLLDILEYTEGFIPDVINIDYPQIMGVEYDAVNFNEEGQSDKRMLKLAGLADKRHCLINAPTQVTTEAIKRGKARMGDGSQSRRAVYAHAALIIGISQTDEEKEFNAKRVNAVAGRFKNAQQSLEVRVLQNLAVGQPYVDSEYARANWGRQEKKGKRRTETEEE